MGSPNSKQDKFLLREGIGLRSRSQHGLWDATVCACQKLFNSMQHLQQAGEREIASIKPAWLMSTGPCSCLGLLQQGNETMADRPLVLAGCNNLLVRMPHETKTEAYAHELLGCFTKVESVRVGQGLFWWGVLPRYVQLESHVHVLESSP